MPSASSERGANPASAPIPGGVIVLRINEIFLKGRNRRAFWHSFLDNARLVLADLDGVTVIAKHLRAHVEHPPGLGAACMERLDRLFGLASMAAARVVANDLDAVAEAAADLATAAPTTRSFKVESKRRDKSFPHTSQDISRHVGTAVALRTGRPVDVRSPEQTIRVELDHEYSYVYSEVRTGPGGLPVGTGGRVALLLSGGIDSPVAGWSIMRRGCQARAIYFHSFPYTGDKSKEKVLDLARHLALWQGGMTVHVVHFTAVQKRLREHCKADLAVLVYRRMMMRTASRIAAATGCKGLVTGENLGQVASQTLDNLGVIADAATMPVLRPLISLDKDEIVSRAQQIGTFATSILPYDDCCSLFVPRHPATRARVRDLRKTERGLDVVAMAEELAEGAERIEVAPAVANPH